VVNYKGELGVWVAKFCKMSSWGPLSFLLLELLCLGVYSIARCLYTGCQLVPQVLLPLACPLAPFPLPVGHGDQGVAQQQKVPSLQQGGTRWRPAREEVRRTIKLHCPYPPAAPDASCLQGAVVSDDHVDAPPREQL